MKLNNGKNAFTLLAWIFLTLIVSSCENSLQSITVATTWLSIPVEGGSVSLEAEFPSSWTASTDASWLTVTPDKGEAGPCTIKFSADAYTGTDRQCKVVLSAFLSKDVTVTLSQSQPNPEFELHEAIPFSFDARIVSESGEPAGEFPIGAQFGVFSKIWFDGSAQGEYFMYNSLLEWDGQTFTTNPRFYWPNSSFQKIEFESAYPYDPEGNLTERYVQVDQSTLEAFQASDLMSAVNNDVQYEDTVILDFKRLCAQFSLEISSSEPISEVTFKGLSDGMAIDLNSREAHDIKSSDDEMEFKPYFDGTVYRLNIPPQTNSFTVTVQKASGEIITKSSARAITLERGVEYKASLNL